MHIQPITNQPNYKGKLIGKGVMLLKDSHWDVPAGMDKNACLEIPDNLLNKMRDLIKDKPYDIFLSQNKKNPDFINIDAGDSFQKVQQGLQGKIKVRRDTLVAFPQAIQDAMDLFEDHLELLKKKKKFLQQK